MKKNQEETRQAGFSLLELLVSLAIIAAVISLAAPAVLHVRATARAAECRSHLRQIMLATASYESTHRLFPPGESNGCSQFVFLLPHLESQALYRLYDFNLTPDVTGGMIQLAYSKPAILECPAGSAMPPHTNYVGNSGTGVAMAGYNGVFQPIAPVWPRHLQDQWKNGPVSIVNVIDGLSQTAAYSEILAGVNTRDTRRSVFYLQPHLHRSEEISLFRQRCRDISTAGEFDGWSRGLPWNSSPPLGVWYNHILAPNQPSCINGTSVTLAANTAASDHSGGVHVAFCDGRVQFVSDNVDIHIWVALGSRNGREIVSAND